MKYEKHVFICTNIRPQNPDQNSCGLIGLELRNKFIDSFKNLNISNISVRFNKSGCLGKCAYGPAIVVYPEGFWYYNVQIDDVSEIISESIIKNKYIKRLQKQ